LNILSDLADKEKYMAHKRRAEDRKARQKLKRVGESSADYMKKKLQARTPF